MTLEAIPVTTNVITSISYILLTSYCVVTPRLHHIKKMPFGIFFMCVDFRENRTPY